METPKISLLFILFTLGFFKGIVLTANTPLDPSTNLISPSKDSIEQLMTDKSVWHIIAEANKYSYTDLNLALIYANIALEHARKTGNLPDIFNAQRGIAFIYEDNAMPEKYLSVYQEAAITAERLPDSFRTTIYNDLAVVNRKVGNFRAAYGYYEKVIDISERSRDNEMLAGAYHGLGTLHREVGVYDKAIGFYLKSLEISQLMQSTQDIIVSHIDIAEAYFKAKEPEKAIIHIEKAYQLAISQQKNKPKDIEPNVQLASAANRYGEILSGKGDFDEALKKHLQALEVYQNIKYKSYIARTLMLVANVYVEQKKFAEASKSYKECLMYEQHFVNADQTELHFKIGAFYRQQHRNHEAESRRDANSRVHDPALRQRDGTQYRAGMKQQHR